MTLIQGFSHLTVEVTDLDRAERFYQDVFGLDLVGRNLISDERPTSLLAMNTRQRILLVKVDSVEPFRPNSSSIHHGWYLTPEQFERALKRLEGMGLNITDSRAAFRAVGERSIDVFDPDGHRYQIQTYLPEATEVKVDKDAGEVECGRADEYKVGDVRYFGKGRFFVVRLEDGFQALSRWCTHMNGQLKWQQEHWQFYCPMHGVTYDRRGVCTSLRRATPMRVHPLTISVDGTIRVQGDAVTVRDAFDPACLVPAPCAASEAH